MFLRKQRIKGKEEVSSPGGDPCPRSAAGGAGLAGGGPVAPHTLGFGAGCRLRLCAGGLCAEAAWSERLSCLCVPSGGTCPLRAGSLCRMRAPRETRNSKCFSP